MLGVLVSQSFHHFTCLPISTFLDIFVPFCFWKFQLIYCLVHTFTSSLLSKLCSFSFLLRSSRISIFSSSTSSCCSSSSHTSSSSWNHNILSESCLSLYKNVCVCRKFLTVTLTVGGSGTSTWQAAVVIWHDIGCQERAGSLCRCGCVFTWISGLVTSRMMLLASSLDNRATAFSLSCTSQPFICTSKAHIDARVKKRELAESRDYIPETRQFVILSSM